jgi:hypothetical protein
MRARMSRSIRRLDESMDQAADEVADELMAKSVDEASGGGGG